MKKLVVTSTATMFLLVSLMGCDAKEREALRNKVTTLEQQLTTANDSLAAKDAELNQLQTQLRAAEEAQAQAQTQITSLNDELSKTKAELEKAKTASTAKKKTAAKR